MRILQNSDPGFHLALNKSVTYNELAEVVFNCIDRASNLIQLFKPNGNAIKGHVDRKLEDFILPSTGRKRYVPKLYYRRLNILIYLSLRKEDTSNARRWTKVKKEIL